MIEPVRVQVLEWKRLNMAFLGTTHTGVSFSVGSAGTRKRQSTEVYARTAAREVGAVFMVMVASPQETSAVEVACLLHWRKGETAVGAASVRLDQLLPYNEEHDVVLQLRAPDGGLDDADGGDQALLGHQVVCDLRVAVTAFAPSRNPPLQLARSTAAAIARDPQWWFAVLERRDLYSLLLAQAAGLAPRAVEAGSQDTPLHVAVRMPQEAFAAALLDCPGVDVQAKNVDGNTPLHLFCKSFVSDVQKCARIFDKLRARGARVDDTNSAGETPLHRATLNPRISVVVVGLLLRCGVDVNARTARGSTPLHYAVQVQNTSLIHVLMEAGADPRITDNHGQTPLAVARALADRPTVALLTDYQDLDWLLAQARLDDTETRLFFYRKKWFRRFLPELENKHLQEAHIDPARFPELRAFFAAPPVPPPGTFTPDSPAATATASSSSSSSSSSTSSSTSLSRSSSSASGTPVDPAVVVPVVHVVPGPPTPDSPAPIPVPGVPASPTTDSASTSLTTPTLVPSPVQPQPQPQDGRPHGVTDTDSTTSTANTTGTGTNTTVVPEGPVKPSPSTPFTPGFDPDPVEEEEAERRLPDVPVIPESEVQLGDKLGEGSAGVVYRALYAGRAVAVKVLRASGSETDRDTETFMKECRVNSALSSPYVAQLYGIVYGRDVLPGKMAMVMELCECGSLYDVLTAPAEIGWGDALSFMLQTAMGLLALHSHVPPILHRDLKSLNILVTRDDRGRMRLKICDFGLSRTDVGSNFKTLNKLRGTYTYAGLLSPFVLSLCLVSCACSLFVSFLLLLSVFFFSPGGPEWRDVHGKERHLQHGDHLLGDCDALSVPRVPAPVLRVLGEGRVPHLHQGRARERPPDVPADHAQHRRQHDQDLLGRRPLHPAAVRVGHLRHRGHPPRVRRRPQALRRLHRQKEEGPLMSHTRKQTQTRLSRTVPVSSTSKKNNNNAVLSLFSLSPALLFSHSAGALGTGTHGRSV